MKPITLRPVNLERDFGQIAALFSIEQDEPTSVPGLTADYEEHKERIIRLKVAEDEQGNLVGFNWVTLSRSDASQAYFYVLVKPEQRGQGAGNGLFEDVLLAAEAMQVKTLQVNIRDNCPECRIFAERRGFTEQSHRIAMELDLEAFDDQPYEPIITRLEKEGFQFTSMKALGNTEEAQQKLYLLNTMTAMETPGSEGEQPWPTFEDFQKRVCQRDWYKPGGQMVVIDSTPGKWAGMSAITRFEGSDHAYNLHTGVDRHYRGRKLGQAVKVTALRHARKVLKVIKVLTHHNPKNLPMLAIDHKLGYTLTVGEFVMKKNLE